MANEQEDHALVANEEAPIEFALIAKTSAECEVFDNSLCSKNCKKNTVSLNSKITDLTDKLSDNKNMLFHFKAELLKKEKGELETKLTGFQTASKDLDNLLESQILDKNKEGLGYSAIPPTAQVYSPPKKDLSWTGIPEFADDTVTDYSRPSPTVESTSDDVQNRNSFETEASSSPISSKPFIKFVKATVRPTENKIVKVESIKKHVVKACFYYGHFDHLSNDCGLGVKKGRSCPKNNCSNKSMTPKAVIHKPYRPPMRPVRPNMNVAQPKRTSFYKITHSYSKRPFQRTLAMRSQYKSPWVSTVNRNFPNVNRKFPTVNRKFPTGSTKFSTADMGKRGNAVKASACWIWKPRQNLTNKGPNSNSVSVMFKKYTYIDIQGRLKHMTGYISYFSDYELFDGGYVSIGQGGCKITGKGTIKTDKLEFENVYFVKDLKYKLFSVSQICDNKNRVVFTDSECIVLGRDFKLIDDTNGSSQNNIDDKSYWDSGCSRHMTGNISYISDYEPFNEGYVSFGQGASRLLAKEQSKPGILEFENVYFVKDL
nr:ribonuclease H-like domain-containing protein [Tanacetum cinerariifolium]